MQALWSRVAQVRSSCRCNSCLHAAPAIARRTATATSRRGARAGDLMTACYSTILATAVFADAAVKEHRRQEWDRIIAEARAGNPVGEADIPASTYGQRKAMKKAMEMSLNIKSYRTNDRLGSWHRTSWRDPQLLPMLEHEDMRKWLTEFLDFPVQCNGVQDAQEEDILSPPDQSGDWQDVDDDGALPSQRFTPREPWKEMHVIRMAQMVRGLVDDLLAKGRVLSLDNRILGVTKSDAEPVAQKIKIAQRIKELRMDFIPSPAYSWDSASAVQQQRTALHKALVTLCAKSFENHRELDLLVAKICYNLLISTTPPNIGTYNILLREFSRLKLHKLAQIVVDSLLHQSKLRPNERTIVLILDHYIDQGDKNGFQDIIERMCAVDGHMNINSIALYQLCNPEVQEWVAANRVVLRGRRLNQKTDRTAAIFASLFRGAFEMMGLGPSIRLIRAAFREGQEVSSYAIYRVAEACVDRMDYQAARDLLQVILSVWEVEPQLLTWSGSNFRYMFHKLLALCNIDPALGTSSLAPPFILQHLPTLQNMQRWLNIESVKDSLDRNSRVTKFSSMAVAKISRLSELPCPEKDFMIASIDYTSMVLNAHLRAQKARDSRKERRMRETWTTRLRALESEIKDQAATNADLLRDIRYLEYLVLLLRQHAKNIAQMDAIERDLHNQVQTLNFLEHDFAMMLHLSGDRKIRRKTLDVIKHFGKVLFSKDSLLCRVIYVTVRHRLWEPRRLILKPIVRKARKLRSKRLHEREAFQWPKKEALQLKEALQQEKEEKPVEQSRLKQNSQTRKRLYKKHQTPEAMMERPIERENDHEGKQVKFLAGRPPSGPATDSAEKRTTKNSPAEEHGVEGGGAAAKTRPGNKRDTKQPNNTRTVVVRKQFLREHVDAIAKAQPRGPPRALNVVPQLAGPKFASAAA